MSKNVGVFALVKSAGIIIKEYLVRKDIKQNQLADGLGEKPQSVGRKLKANKIPVRFVEKVSDVLKHNFFFDLSEEYRKSHIDVVQAVMEDSPSYGKKKPGSDNAFSQLIENEVAKALDKLRS